MIQCLMFKMGNRKSPQVLEDLLGVEMEKSIMEKIVLGCLKRKVSTCQKT